jgi:beta-phosphoglucomutase
MIKALILDYNGVIVNDEPIHLKAFKEVFAEAGLQLDDDEYFSRYLGISDFDIVRDAIRRMERPAGRGSGKQDGEFDARINHLVARKALAFRNLVRRHLPESPGASEFIRKASQRFPVAVASGAIRVEIEDGLERLGVRDAVSSIVSIENVTRGKPDPETFLRAREALIRFCSIPGAGHQLTADEPAASFLVIEDSPAGLAAARAAWMPAIALTTSLPEQDMKPAEMVVANLQALTLEAIENI